MPSHGSEDGSRLTARLDMIVSDATVMAANSWVLTPVFHHPPKLKINIRESEKGVEESRYMLQKIGQLRIFFCVGNV